ncbi:lipid-A-disaccharide synthase N-terminal domain-containing protein [uncultured Cyclobacterium sp.]|uniref:lipid-A-disaccharide synthase N-terminal domain-containing protein n=1 Tax=uncultured Cyclobacterium sp. TaxID=453820 RepID=UPI0030EE5800
MKNWPLLGIGFLAQGLFSARFLIQLVKSEKAGKVLSPVIFWQLSLMASFLLLVYGTFREDMVIVGGQLIGYYIYIRNLQILNAWKAFTTTLRLVFLLLPLFFLLYLLFVAHYDFFILVNNPEISKVLLTWGTFGQAIFTLRFVVQWRHAEKKRKAEFPLAFWYISLVGALLIASYAIYRKDSVLFIGQAFGIIVYLRNLMINSGKVNLSRQPYLYRLKRIRLFLLILFTGLALFFNLGSWSVTESSEARYAEISKEMLTNGDLLHPQLMGIYHFHKPPVTYWLTALSFKLFGTSAFSARLFLQLAALILIWLVYKIALVFFNNPNQAFLAAMLYASFPTLIIGSRALTTDMYLTLFVTATMYFWFLYCKKQKPILLILCYVFLGFGFLTKGPVVLIVPAMVSLFQGLVQKQNLGSWKIHVIGIFLMLAIGLSWFVYLYLEDARFLNYFLFKHTIQRFATNTFQRGQPFWFYIAVLLGTAFPWVILLFKQFPVRWKDFQNNGTLLLMWVLLPLLFFSMSQSKLVLYILPIYPGLAIGTIYYWEKLKPTQHKIWERFQSAYHIVLMITLLSLPLMDTRISLNYKYYFIWFILASLLVTIQQVNIRKLDRTVISAFIFTLGLTCMSTYFLSQNPGVINDTHRVTDWILDHEQAESRVYIYDKRMPSGLFNSNLQVISVFDGDESLNRETQFQQDQSWKSQLINMESNPDWITSSAPHRSIWIMKSKKKLPQTDENFSWVQLKEIDGWKIVRLVKK